MANGTPGHASYRFGGETFRLAPRVARTHEVCSATRLAVGADADGIRVDADARFTVDADAAGVPRLRRDRDAVR